MTPTIRALAKRAYKDQSMMTSLYHLWHRAGLWRACLIISVLSSTMAVFLPTASLKHLAPWLPGKAPPLLTPPKDTTHPHPPEGGGDTEGGKVAYLDPSQSVSDRAPLAGHVFPLPEGQWHPVLAAQTNDRAAFSFLALIRTDHGAVTGFITLQTNQNPVPAELVESLLTPCHDDRNYTNLNQEAPDMADCVYVANAVLEKGMVSNNPLIAEAVAHVQQLGFPLPPLMIVTGWRHISAAKNGLAQTATEDVLLSPLDRETHQMLAPPDVWSKETITANPVAEEFINKVLHWTPYWQKGLLQAFIDPKSIEFLPVEATRDPMAPQ